MTPSNLRSISRQLYAEPVTSTFADCKPMVRPSDHIGQYAAIKCKVRALHLSWVNDFLTVNCFASYYGLTRQTALRVINLGRKLNS